MTSKNTAILHYSTTPPLHHSTAGFSNPRVLGAFTLSFVGVLLATLSFAIGPGTWSPTGSMTARRQNHTAALISPCEALVVGGSTGVPNRLQATAMRFVYADSTWRDAASMNTKRQFHTETSLSTAGQILVAGGVGSDGTPLATTELYDQFPVSGPVKWTFQGSMSTARYAHSAVLLSNGQVLVAGGIDANGAPLTSVEVFHPVAGTWSATGNMITARHDQTATLLPDGKVLVTGGIGANGAILSSAEVYDPTSGTWSATIVNMNAPRVHHTATALTGGGIILISGGSGSQGNLASAELYIAGTGIFVPTGSMNTARDSHTANLLISGQVLVAGGNDGSSTLASAELYDQGVWLPTASMAAARRGHISAPLPAIGVCAGTTTVGAPADFVLVAGGNGPSGTLASAEVYDQAHGLWSPVSDMATHRYEHTATLLPNGKVLVAGGLNGSRSSLESAYLYDPDTGTFSQTGSMSIGRDLATATLLPTGKVLVTGGISPDGIPLSSTELYDPATGDWSMTGDMTIGRAWHAATLLGNGKVLVTGGDDPTFNELQSAELYDPATGTWSATGAMTEARVAHSSTLLNTGEVLVTGSTRSFSTFPDLYDPVTGTFSLAVVMHVPRFAPKAALLPTGNVLVAGGTDPSARPTNEAELYDPAFDPTIGRIGRWIVTGSMNVPRVYFSAVMLPNGNVLVSGGETGTGPTASSDFYVPSTGNWQVTGIMTDTRKQHTGTLLNTGKVLVTGGLNGQSQSLATAELYDPGPLPPPVQLTGIVSRITHGTAGTFDINLPPSGSPGIECRSGGANGSYTLVFTFANPLTNVASASVTGGTGSVVSSTIDSNDAHNYIVNLTGVTNAQVVTVSLTNVADSVGNFSPAVAGSMGVLLGDTSGDGVVNSADITQTRRQSGNVANSSNFREDVTLDGVINSADITLVRRQSGTALP